MDKAKNRPPVNVDLTVRMKLNNKRNAKKKKPLKRKKGSQTMKVEEDHEWEEDDQHDAEEEEEEETRGEHKQTKKEQGPTPNSKFTLEAAKKVSAKSLKKPQKTGMKRPAGAVSSSSQPKSSAKSKNASRSALFLEQQSLKSTHECYTCAK